MDLPVQGGSRKSGRDDIVARADERRPKAAANPNSRTASTAILAAAWCWRAMLRPLNALMQQFSERQVEKPTDLWSAMPWKMHGTIDLPLAKEKEHPRATGHASGPEGRDYEIVQVDEEEGEGHHRLHATLPRPG